MVMLRFPVRTLRQPSSVPSELLRESRPVLRKRLWSVKGTGCPGCSEGVRQPDDTLALPAGRESFGAMGSAGASHCS